MWPFVPYNTKYWKANMIISEICVCLAYFNSCINPLVYVLCYQDLKKRFYKAHASQTGIHLQRTA